MERPFNLLIVYNAAENVFSISAHNQTPEEARELIQEFDQHLKPGFKLLAIEQHKAHKAVDAQNCRACRNAVRRSSGLQPSPTFRRRML